jgi:Bacterial Ig domain/Concanavalin A-like lectin/glucanases superfamily/Leucine rich repeat/Fibronectin type III domain
VGRFSFELAVYGLFTPGFASSRQGEQTMTIQPTATNHARSNFEPRNHSSQKGYAMNQLVGIISKSVIVVSGMALASALGACGQAPHEVVAPLEQVVQAKPEVLSQPTLKTASIDDGLVGYWPFDENGTSKADHSPNHNTMNFYGSLAADPNTPNLGFPNPLALLFTNTPNSYGAASGNGINQLQTYTVSFWMRIQAKPGSGQRVHLFEFKNKVRFSYDYDSQNLILDVANRSITWGEIVTPGVYHHVVGTFNGTTARLSVDGIDRVGVNAGASPQGQGIMVGDPSQGFTGSLDDARIYNRALSPAEIQDWFLCGRGPGIPASECRALVAFDKSMGMHQLGSQKVSDSGWGITNTPCKWYGVACIDGHVLALALPDILTLESGFGRGRVLSDLSDLTQLQLLDLRNDGLNVALTDTIPESLGKLPNLKVLALSGNGFIGPIPESFKQLGNLVTLDLSNNKLGGTVPNSLGQLGKLETLDLSGNQLSEGIPYGIASLPKLKTLNLQNNQLRGPIPTQLGNSSATMNLGYNMLSSTDTNLLALLKTRAPGWEATQTVPVSNVQARVLSDTSAMLTWKPVAYSADGGYYDILSMPAGGNLFKSVGHTTNKTSSSFTVTGLTAAKSYSFVIRTFTPKHTDQQNDLSSDSTNPVTVTMTGNHAPVAVGETYSTVMNTPLSVNAARGILANDSDPDGDPIRFFAISTSGQGGRLTPNRDGSFTFTPDPGFVGTVDFAYQLNDGKLNSNSTHVSFQVLAPAPGSVGVIVYQELNFNATWDFNESILPGWTVTAKNNQTGQTRILLSGASLVPARFANLTPGSYTICQTTKPGWTSLSGDSSAGCYTRNVVSGHNLMLWFGNANQ